MLSLKAIKAQASVTLPQTAVPLQCAKALARIESFVVFSNDDSGRFEAARLRQEAQRFFVLGFIAIGGIEEAIIERHSLRVETAQRREHFAIHHFEAFFNFK